MKNTPEKVDFGRSVVAALVELYDTTTPESDPAREDLFVESVSRQAIRIETVGFEKVQLLQSQLDLHTMVQLKQARVASAGEAGNLERLSPSESL